MEAGIAIYVWSLEEIVDLLKYRHMSTEHVALERVKAQLQKRGFDFVPKARNSSGGNIHAKRGNQQLRIAVKGLAKRNGVWLKERQVASVDIIVIYLIQDDDVWVFSPAEARALLVNYRADFILRNGRPPAAEGFNWSELPMPSGWSALDRLIPPAN
jgi:hypothetical protein